MLRQCTIYAGGVGYMELMMQLSCDGSVCWTRSSTARIHVTRYRQLFGLLCSTMIQVCWQKLFMD